MVELRIEPLSFMLMHGLIDLAFEAWNETNFQHEHPHNPYSPDWEAYQRQEANNMMRLIAMREDGKLIGYTSIVVDIDVHNSALLTATIRDIFVTREKRGHAAKLVRYTESLLPAMNVQRALIGQRLIGLTPQSIEQTNAFFSAMGYEQRELIYGKTIH